MKPTKNRVYCPDCGRTKMLFEEEKKALNFIKFNADSMTEECNGKVPTRAYFCMACAGWHLTSSETVMACKSPTERILECHERQKAAATRNKINDVITRTHVKLSKADEYIRNIDILAAAKMLMQTSSHLKGTYGNYQSQEIKDLLDSTLYKLEKMLEVFAEGISALIVNGNLSLASEYLCVLDSIIQSIKPKHTLFSKIKATYSQKYYSLLIQIQKKESTNSNNIN
jgi:hypothetical protein